MPSSPVRNAAVTGNLLVHTGPVTLHGGSFPNAAIVYDGIDATGKVVLNFAVATGGSIYLDKGVRMNVGVFVAAGAGAGSVWLA